MRNRIRKIALVDGENIGSLSKYSSLSSDYEEIYYFLGASQRLHPELKQKHPNIKIIEIDEVGKNNLDFHLAMYLGCLHEKLNNDLVFEVISNDMGFDGIIGFINKNWNRKCVRESILLNSKHHKHRKLYDHFLRRSDNFAEGLPKNIDALHNYLIATSLSTPDNVYNHIDILFNKYGLYFDLDDRIRYDLMCHYPIRTE